MANWQLDTIYLLKGSAVTDGWITSDHAHQWPRSYLGLEIQVVFPRPESRPISIILLCGWHEKGCKI